MSKKLLLADDSLTIQKVVGIVFANLDYQLLVADNGEAALELARKEFPALVIADIGMPGMDGLELCRQLKADADLAGVPVLLLPGAFEHFDEGKAEAAGADGWLTKPFESQALIGKVEELLAAAPARLAAVPPVAAAVDEAPAELEPLVFEEFEPEVEAGVEEEAEFEAAEALAPVPEMVEFGEPEALDESGPGEDIWDSVTFEEEDLKVGSGQPVAAAGADQPIQFEEPETLTEEPETLAEEPEFLIEEPELPGGEPESLVEEPGPFAVAEAFAAQSEEVDEGEILDLGEEDILELDEDSIIEEEELPVAEEPVSLEEEPSFFEEEPSDFAEEFAAAPLVDFSAPSSEPVAGESDFVFSDPGSESESLTGVAARQDDFAAEIETYDLDAEPGAEPEAVTPLPVAASAVAEQLSRLDESEMEAVIRRVAGPMIEKMASQLLEQVVWEVVPDLAESMIKDEIRKIKEGAA